MLSLTTDGMYVTERVSFRSRGDLTAIDAADPIEVSITWEQLNLGTE